VHLLPDFTAEIFKNPCGRKSQPLS
jgi:hypothetical protein